MSGRGPILSAVAAVDVTDAAGRSVTDIDGLSVVFRGDGMWLLLAEAKDRAARSAAAARRQLERRLNDMGLTSALDRPRVQEIHGKGAYVFARVR